MNLKDWEHFLKHGSSQPIAIAQVSPEIAAHLGAISTFVYLHHEYARKSVEKHHLDPSDFHMIFETVDYGAALADRDDHLTFLHEEAGHWFQVTVKRAPKDGKIYVVTFYKQKLREVVRKRKKYPTIRP